MEQAASDNRAEGDVLNGFPREEAALLLALREGMRGRKLDPARHASVLAGVDWGKLVELAFENRVAALLHFALTPIVQAGLAPARQASTLRRFFHETTQRNLRIKLDLKEILAACGRRGIEVILLKGVHLAFSVWPSMAVRQMHDVDIVVRRRDVVAAANTLEDLGYVTDREHSAEWHVANPNLHHLPEFTRPSAVAAVELHQFFSPRTHFDHELDAMWNNSAAIDFDGVPARVLSPDDLLINLCLHVTTCGPFLQGNLRSLLDIAVASQSCGLALDRARWAGLLSDARFGLLLQVPLYLSLQYLGARYHPEIEARVTNFAPIAGARLRILQRAGKGR